MIYIILIWFVSELFRAELKFDVHNERYRRSENRTWSHYVKVRILRRRFFFLHVVKSLLD